MLDHTGIFVPSSQHAEVVNGTRQPSRPLGYEKFLTEGPREEVTGFSGNGKHADWWLISTVENIPDKPKVHHAFVAKNRAVVDAFHAAALAVGGNDNGKPGIREVYPHDYYAAFVFDLLRYNIEAVCHSPV